MTKTESLAGLAVVGLAIGKNVFNLVGFDPAGEIVVRRKIKRLGFEKVFETLPRCVVGMEACLSAHFVSRRLRAMGFEPRIIPAKYTKPFIKGQKNDYNDAEAIAEAALRPNLKLVREKTQEQLDLQGAASCPLPAGVAPHGDDQPDPGFPDRTGHHGEVRCARAAQLAVCDPQEPGGGDIAADERHHRRAL
jgi:hypothetical protein